MSTELVARAKAGDQDAFRELVGPYRAELHMHCYRILGSLQDAEDQLQAYARETGLVFTGESDNIADQKLRQIQEELSRAEAERANQLKDEFLATISHELRNPLNAILGWAHMMRLGNLTPANAERAVETIYRNAKSQAQLVADLLDVSRIISGKLRLDVRPADLRHVVEAAIESVRTAADAKGIALETRLPATPAHAAVDPDRLQQIVWNLLSNAIKFTPAGGRIAVAATLADGMAEVSVSDTGAGIAPEDQELIFEEFRQAGGDYARKREGTGLGLALTKRFVELHGGRIWVESTPGKGSTFSFTLPIRRPAEVRT